MVTGLLVKYLQLVEFLGGYDPAKVEDKTGFADWVGAHFIILGLISFLVCGLGYAAHVDGIIRKGKAGGQERLS